MKKLFRKVLVSLTITLGITSTVLISFPSSVQAADSSFQNIQRGLMIIDSYKLTDPLHWLKYITIPLHPYIW